VISTAGDFLFSLLLVTDLDSLPPDILVFLLRVNEAFFIIYLNLRPEFILVADMESARL
jgi:hypothetical protein